MAGRGDGRSACRICRGMGGLRRRVSRATRPRACPGVTRARARDMAASSRLPAVVVGTAGALGAFALAWVAGASGEELVDGVGFAGWEAVEEVCHGVSLARS